MMGTRVNHSVRSLLLATVRPTINHVDNFSIGLLKLANLASMQFYKSFRNDTC